MDLRIHKNSKKSDCFARKTLDILINCTVLQIDCHLVPVKFVFQYKVRKYFLKTRKCSYIIYQLL